MMSVEEQTKGLGKIIEMFESVLKKDKKNIQQVQVVTKPYEFGKPIIKRATTTSNSRNETPSIKIENPLDRDIRIFAVSMIPDAGFKTNGRLEIQTNGVTYLDEEDAATFTDIIDTNLPIPKEGELLKAGESLEFYIRNDDNSTSVAITVLVYLGARRS